MALLTGGRKPQLDVIHRRRRGVVVLLMTADACRVCAGQVVVIVDVAHHTRDRGIGVIASQGEARLGMIKLRRLPGRGVMTHLASLREVVGDVIRIVRAVEILQMAVEARRVRRGQAVIVVHVALRALDAAQMESSQRPARRRVIELGVGPVRGVVALLAGCRKAELHVIHGRCRVVVVLLVTTDARCAAQRVVIVHVAHDAGHRRTRVGACQREAYGAVIERCRHPSAGRMALRAIGRESCSGVHRVVGLLKIGLMAADTSRVGGAQVVIVVGVTAGARRGRMQPGQGKSRSRVVEFSVQPVVKAVALRAIGRELAGRMVGIAGLIKVGCVAAVAIRRCRAEVAQRSVLMTGLALDRGMSAQKREAVLVILDRLYRNLPARHRVALFAARA